MRVPALFRKREIWAPTLPGALAILALAAVLVAGFARGIHAFLSPWQPLGEGTLVVEGWVSDEELDQVVDAVRRGSYVRIVTAGGPVPRAMLSTGFSNYADLGKHLLESHDVRGLPVVSVPAPASAQERTYLSAVMVREWARGQRLDIDSIDVFSSGVHGRRSWLIYRLAFGPKTRVGILSARPSTYEAESWWRTSLGAKTVLSETVSWVWTVLFFHPAPAGSEGEKWGDPSSWTPGRAEGSR